jgi:hypothetical protein
MRLRRLLVAVVLFGLAGSGWGCALRGGVAAVKQPVAVSTLTVHHVLMAVHNAERAMRCGLPTAPSAGMCVTPELHRDLSARFETAFRWDKNVLRLVEAVPEGEMEPAAIGRLVAQISQMVADILAALPESPQKAALEARVGVR